MTTYTVAADGTLSPSTPAFPQPTLDDVLVPDSSLAGSGSSAIVDLENSLTLRSLYVGSNIEVDLGLFSAASLRGTGSITGSSALDPDSAALVSYGTIDINGSIDINFSSNSNVLIATNERLDLEGDVSGLGASTVTVASGGELDINSVGTAILSSLSSQGALVLTAPNISLSGTTTLGGTVRVQGDALNGFGSGVAAARSSGSAYVATLDLRGAMLTAPITNLALAQDAQVRFGTGPTTLSRFVVAGSATASVPLDVVSLDGTVTVTGDGSGAGGQAVIGEAEFTGGHTIDFAVAARDGGARLQQQIMVDAATTLRNDASMSVGGPSGAATSLGATSAAAGSALINGAAGQLSIAAGAAISVAAIQNAGAIAVAGNTTVLSPFSNTGTVDVTAGTLAVEAAMSGAGTIQVENGAVLALDASEQGNVSLRNGALLKLSQPATFTGSLQAPAIGARIDLVGINAVSATVSQGTVAIATGTGSLALSETGLINGSTLALGADGSGGTLLTVTASNLPHPVAYRFFDDVHGTHFFTTSLGETQMLQATRSDLVYEGIGLGAADPTIDPAAAPVYRFFDTKFGTHFYTASATERNDVLASRPDLVSEGVGFYEHTSAQPGDVAVYRFFDAVFGTHFYTANAGERATIIATRPDLVSEGIGFYAPSTT